MPDVWDNFNAASVAAARKLFCTAAAAAAAELWLTISEVDDSFPLANEDEANKL